MDPFMGEIMNKRDLVVFDAPSNLGLNPTEIGVVPGCSCSRDKK
jgi:hypothetical protein